MAIVTAGDMVAAALRSSGIIGVGQSASAEDANTGLELLNEVIYGWARDRTLAWQMRTVTVPSTGQATYALADRPPHLSSAYLRLLTTASVSNAGAIDFPLQVIASRDAYNEISFKGLSAFPAAVYYETATSGGTLYFWPIPAAGSWEMHITYPYQPSGYTSLTTNLGLPPEYLEPLRYALAIKLAMDYGMAPNQGQVARLRGVLARLRAANWQPKSLELPWGGGAWGWSNVFGGYYSAAAAAVDITNAIEVSLLPTSDAGLPIGALWMNNGVLTVVE